MQYNFESSPERLKLPEAPRARIGIISAAIRNLESVPSQPETSTLPPQPAISTPSASYHTDYYSTRRQENIDLDEQAIRRQIEGVFKEAA